MEISAAWVGVGATVGSIVGGLLLRWVDGQIASVKATQKLLFEKYDAQEKDLQSYKLHVAETYVNQAALEKALAPMNKALEEIKEELREERRKP
jgi:uncharacterized membrane-anchored protein YhcB (DUF1043 family)